MITLRSVFLFITTWKIVTTYYKLQTISLVCLFFLVVLWIKALHLWSRHSYHWAVLLTQKYILTVHISFYYLFIVIPRFELKASCILGRCCTAWAPSGPFCSSCFGSHFLPQPAWTEILLFYASHSNWDVMHIPPHSTFCFCFSITG